MSVPSLARQLCAFQVGDLWFGLDVLLIQEILRPQTLARIPLAPPVLRGLLNLRGQIVPALDLRLRLDLPAHDDGRNCMNIILSRPEGPVSLLVDDVGDVLNVTPDSFELPPPTMSAAARQVISGVHKFAWGLLPVLDADRAVQIDRFFEFSSHDSTEPTALALSELN